MTADARVETEKGSRYLQALCGHFSRKVRAEYGPQRGHIEFGVGSCELRAEADALLLHIEAQGEASFTQLKHIVGGHLERFAAKDELKVQWNEATIKEQRHVI